MSNNRHTRNPQQLRALIQNMGRSIEEARQRRIGPDQGADAQVSQQPQEAAPSDRAAAARAANHASTTPPHAPHQMPHQMPPQMPPSSPPPIRSATEMFSESTPRLKARPKRAS